MTKNNIENFTEHCFSKRLIDRLTEENKRLKEQLDKEIHINRKMKKALEDYANHDNWYDLLEWNTYDKQGWETAEEALKEIDNKE